MVMTKTENMKHEAERQDPGAARVHAACVTTSSAPMQ
jgi:hypothetical protein